MILLNHRNDLDNVEKYSTTPLWEGQETYVEMHVYNTVIAPYNRAYMFLRGHTPANFPSDGRSRSVPVLVAELF